MTTECVEVNKAVDELLQVDENINSSHEQIERNIILSFADQNENRPDPNCKGKHTKDLK